MKSNKIFCLVFMILIICSPVFSSCPSPLAKSSIAKDLEGRGIEASDFRIVEEYTVQNNKQGLIEAGFSDKEAEALIRQIVREARANAMKDVVDASSALSDSVLEIETNALIFREIAFQKALKTAEFNVNRGLFESIKLFFGIDSKKEDRLNSLTSLANYGEEGLPVLLEALNHPDSDTRELATRLINQIDYHRIQNSQRGVITKTHVEKENAKYRASLESLLDDFEPGIIEDSLPAVTVDNTVEEPVDIDIRTETYTTGQVIDGRFSLEDIVGQGGIASAYLANDNLDNKAVVVKLYLDPKQTSQSNEEYKKSVELLRILNSREGEVLSILRHPNIVNEISYDSKSERPYLVMEYVPGQSLENILFDNKNKDVVMDVKDASEIAVQVLSALEYMHSLNYQGEQIAHKDIKPANIVLGEDGVVKLIDFGSAGFTKTVASEYPDLDVATPNYAAPEQLPSELKDKYKDAAPGQIDLYSAATMFYEMLTNNPTFKGFVIYQKVLEHDIPDLSSVNPNVPRDLSEAIMKALSQNPDERGSVSELKNVFMKYVLNRDLINSLETKTEVDMNSYKERISFVQSIMDSGDFSSGVQKLQDAGFDVPRFDMRTGKELSYEERVRRVYNDEIVNKEKVLQKSAKEISEKHSVFVAESLTQNPSTQYPELEKYNKLTREIVLKNMAKNALEKYFESKVATKDLAGLEKILSDFETNPEAAFESIKPSIITSYYPLNLPEDLRGYIENIPPGIKVGDFEISSIIGEGGFGQVYVANNNGENVALKVLADPKPSEMDLFMFKKEIQTLNKLKGVPNVVQIVEGESATDLPFIAMELINGQDLEEIVSQKNYGESVFVSSEVVDIGYKVLMILDEMNKKDVHHLDINPKNIIITTDGKVKLIDFGISGLVDATKEADFEKVIYGHEVYSSPEQLRGELDGDLTKLDVYSLGATLYKILTNRYPIKGKVADFTGDVRFNTLDEDVFTPHEFNSDIPIEISDLIMDMMKVNPDERISLSDAITRFRQINGENVKSVLDVTS